jgi:hypothetical protein
MTPKQVTLARIHRKMIEETGQMSGTVVPIPNAFVENEKPLRRKLSSHNYVKVNSYAFASLMNDVNKGQYVSWYY